MATRLPASSLGESRGRNLFWFIAINPVQKQMQVCRFLNFTDIICFACIFAHFSSINQKQQTSSLVENLSKEIKKYSISFTCRKRWGGGPGGNPGKPGPHTGGGSLWALAFWGLLEGRCLCRLGVFDLSLSSAEDSVSFTFIVKKNFFVLLLSQLLLLHNYTPEIFWNICCMEKRIEISENSDIKHHKNNLIMDVT